MSAAEQPALEAMLRRLRHVRGTMQLLAESTSIDQHIADAVEGIADQVDDMVARLAAIVEPAQVKP